MKLSIVCGLFISDGDGIFPLEFSFDLIVAVVAIDDADDDTPIPVAIVVVKFIDAGWLVTVEDDDVDDSILLSNDKIGLKSLLLFDNAVVVVDDVRSTVSRDFVDFLLWLWMMDESKK